METPPLPAASGPRAADHPRRVAAMFGRIAARYDVMNTVMTAGLDAAWRRLAVRMARPTGDGLALDVGTGTGLLAAELAKQLPGGLVIGVDLTEPMLREAPAPAFSVPGGGRVALAVADALALPFPDGAFDCATTAFTVRNVTDVGRAFSELRRVVRPGGRVVCLELSQPRVPIWGALFALYFRRVVPLVGRVVAGDSAAYTYLPESVAAFLDPEALAAEMARAGLRQIRWRRLGLGSVTLHVGVA